MSIQPIKFLKAMYYANRPLEAKLPKQMVKLPVEMEDAMYNKIVSQMPRLEYMAKYANSPITFAPKGKSTLMNFGPFTTVLDNSSTQSEIVKQMDSHINKVIK